MAPVATQVGYQEAGLARGSPQSASPPGVREPLFTPNFLIACFLTLASFTSFYFLLATLPVYLTTIGGSEAQVGLIIGVFSLTSIVLRPIVGALADSRGKRPFIVAGTAIMAVAGVLYTLSTSVPPLLGLRVVHGVGWAAFGTATSALVADIAPRSRRGEAMGYFGMFGNLAMAVGPALGVILMKEYSFVVLFVASALAATAAFGLALQVREPAPPLHSVSPPAAVAPGWLGRVFERSSLFPSAVLALIAFTYAAIVSFLPLYAGRQGIDNPGIFFTAYAVVLLVARSFTGMLSDRFGRAAVIAPGLGLAVAALLLLSTATALPAFIVVAVLYGLAFAAVQPAMMALVVDRVAPQRRGAAMGTFSTAMDLGIGAGSMVWGVVAQAAGYQAMYLAAGGVALLALAVFLFGWRAQPSEARQATARR